MRATDIITSTLQAMGATPTVTSKNGVDIIKINAPDPNSKKKEERKK